MDHAHHQWYRQMQRALQLGGKSPNTQESYLRSVRQLADRCGKDPQQVTEQQLSHRHPLSAKRESVEAGNAAVMLRRAQVLLLIGCCIGSGSCSPSCTPRTSSPFRSCLREAEVAKILSHLTTFHNFTFLSTVYACGLRLAEALALTIDDIDAEAMLVHVRRGKGSADRTVPMPEHTLRHSYATRLLEAG